jgi:hypothetical protein
MPVAGGPKITKTGILLDVDAADKQSYPGSGTTWTNQVPTGLGNGTLNNISFDSTDSKGALIFTGSNTFVDFGNIGNLSSAWSFQVAFKPAPTSSGDAYTILSYASGSDTGSLTFKLDYSSSTQEVILSTFSTASATAKTVHAISASVASGSWSILNGTYGTSILALFKDGNFITSTPTTGSTVGYNSSNRLYLGGTYGLDSGYYTGSVASLVINQADLDIRVVTNNYNAFFSRFGLTKTPGLVTDFDVINFIESTGLSNEIQISAINNLVIGLKANNLWNKMLAIYPLVGGSAYSHKFNLKTPVLYNIKWFGAVDHAINPGVTFTNGYGECGVSPVDTGDQNDFHFSVYTRNTGSAANFGYIAGQGRGGTHFTEMNWFGGPYHNMNNNNSPGEAVANIKGSLLMSRITSTVVSGYNNGVLRNNRNLTSTGISTAQIILNSNGNSSNINLAFATVGYGLTNVDAANLHNLIQTYQTTLGRNV